MVSNEFYIDFGMNLRVQEARFKVLEPISGPLDQFNTVKSKHVRVPGLVFKSETGLGLEEFETQNEAESKV